MSSHTIAVIGIGSIRPGGAWEHVVHGQGMAVLVTLPFAVPSRETERTCARALTMTAPDSTTATHSAGDVQDTPRTNRDPMPPSAQALGPPPGFAETDTPLFVPASNDTHNDGEAHETPPAARGPWVTVQAPDPPVGLLELRTSVPRVATQSGPATHEMLAEPAATWMLFQTPAPPVGFVAVSTLPCSSKTAQREAATHETPSRPRSP